MPLPKDLLPFAKEASDLIKAGHIQAIEFSGRTYQINVFDAGAQEAYWAFLHLTEQGEIADSFCLCSDETEADRCVHLAASFLRIYNGKPEPLHVRYQRCFWRALGLILDAKFDKRARTLIHPKTPSGTRFLKELFEKAVPPTEETSLKFSDLTEGELQTLREGNITPKLHYEFSFWSDLAKSLLLIQENKGAIAIHFQEDKQGFPTVLTIATDDIEFSLTLTLDELISLIPCLATVDSPLKVRGGFKDRIEKASFDPKTGTLRLTHSNFDLQKLTGLKIGNWLYKGQEGFFRLEGDPQLLQEHIPKEEMDRFLSQYHQKLGGLVNPGVYELKAHLAFDKEENLHLTHYLLSPGDLSLKTSWHFGDWVFIENQGFFRTLWPQDLPQEMHIKKGEVYEWVITHQTYLNGIEGFRVHLKAVESIVCWHVQKDGSLTFSSSLKGEFSTTPREYGALVWIEGQGFFSKNSLQEALQLPSGTPIPASQVASYLRHNESELRLIPGFFLSKMPLHKMGLKLDLKNGKVSICPIVELIGEYQGHSYRFYSEYIYIESKGFYSLSERHFLPVEWREEHSLSPLECIDFFGKTFQKLEPFIFEIPPALMAPKRLKLLYDKTLSFQSEVGELPFADFLNAYKRGQRFYFSPAGRLDLHEKRFVTLGELFKKSRYPELTLLELYKLNALEDIDIKFQELLKERPLDLSGLKSTLRPYQETGVKWLWSLYCNQLSGLLCDDMGLGKTHQAMALMAAIGNSQPKSLRFLVVCPTSVLYHWEEKLAQFLPDLKVVVFHGLKRTLVDFEKHEGLLLTSYGILRNEIETLKMFRFELAIFDEIQLAKNHLSRLWHSLREINAEMILGLTGTPIENHLRELKSLFDLVLPALMPSEQDYMQKFIKPIEQKENLQAKALLHRYIDPFVLRRKKSDVLLDLPEKTEEISHTDLAVSQRKLYHEVFETARHTVLEELHDEKKLIPYIHIFALLSSLKKICDHPALYLKQTANYKKFHSGKWELFVELLSEALASEQKVVVFSHFLGMLDIIEAYLLEEGIAFASLRGSTPNRREMIDRFQNQPECKVFVASLQAGGLGIDLTAASVVIHYDRWWNAARENQATDRVHRIGQKRGVQVFKLVTLHTVEERIHTLIERKQKRMEEIVGTDDAQVIKTLTRDELIELLKES